MKFSKWNMDSFYNLFFSLFWFQIDQKVFVEVCFFMFCLYHNFKMNPNNLNERKKKMVVLSKFSTNFVNFLYLSLVDIQ